jgi:hypothetical protein
MRSDMAKVLVERPRVGSRNRGVAVKGYRKRLRKLLDSGDGPPAREGIERLHGGTKFFNEHLGPLRRYVGSQIGRPWDKVYSEICERVDRGNVVQKHILTHLYDYVLTRVILIDGEPCYGGVEYFRSHLYGRPLRELDLRQLCYVCPKSGILKRVPPRRRPQPPRGPKPPAYVRVSDRLQCRFIAGRWELVTLAPLPDAWHRAKAGQVDVVLKKPVHALDESEARAAYGAAVYAESRRVLRKSELRNYPIPIDLIR